MLTIEALKQFQKQLGNPSHSENQNKKRIFEIKESDRQTKYKNAASISFTSRLLSKGNWRWVYSGEVAIYCND